MGISRTTLSASSGVLALGVTLAAPASAADRCGEDTSPLQARAPDPRAGVYDHAAHVRATYGAGVVVDAPHFTHVLGVEVDHHPLCGALSTGLAFAATFGPTFYVLTPYLFARFDLVYPFASGGWDSWVSRRYTPPPVRVRVHVGFGLGLDASESHPPVSTPEPSYVLVRPVAQPFLDVEIPVANQHTFVARGAWDTSVSSLLGTPWRFSVSFGWSFGFWRIL